ncbi:MAG: hypothetical protein WD423_11320 [Rhodothermales bacterium]
MWVFIVAITGIIFGSWALVSVTRAVVSYLQGSQENASMTTSELAAVVRNAVEEAVRPLEEKVDRLEEQQKRLTSSAPGEASKQLGVPPEHAER